MKIQVNEGAHHHLLPLEHHDCSVQRLGIGLVANLVKTLSELHQFSTCASGDVTIDHQAELLATMDVGLGDLLSIESIDRSIVLKPT